MRDFTITPSSDHTSERSGWDEDLLARVKSYLERQLDGWGEVPVPREDLIGEVLLRLLAHEREDIRYPVAYSGTILRNLIRDKIRELERAQRLFERAARYRLATARDKEYLPGTEFDAFDDEELLRYLLEKAELSPIQERVIHMIYFEGLSTTQAARSLGKNPGTIQRHHERGIEKLAWFAARAEAQR